MSSAFQNLVPERLRARRPILFRLRSAQWFIVLTVCVAVFTDVFLYSVIVPVLPFAIESRVGLPHDEVQHWVSVLLAVYGAALLVSSPIFGILADRIKSRQTPLLGGLIVLMGSTVMFCLGRSIPVLVVARLLQGASAGTVWTVALALLSDTVGKDESAQALGFVAAAYSCGTLVGPLLGGLVYQQSGYYEVFGEFRLHPTITHVAGSIRSDILSPVRNALASSSKTLTAASLAMTFGVIGLDIILRLLIIEKHKAAPWLDDAADVTGLELHHVPVHDSGKSSAKGAEAAPSGSIEVVRLGKKTPTIFILLKSHRLQAAFAGIFISSATMTAFDATLPLFVNRLFNWGSLGAGLIFIALLVPHLGGPFIGHCVDKFGPRWIAAVGLLLLLPFWVLLRLVDHDGIRQVVLLVSLLVGIGIASALLNTSLMAEFSKICDSKERRDPSLFNGRSAYATAYGILNVSWALGSLVGPLMAAAIERSAGWKTMTWVFGLLAAACLPAVVMFTGGLIGRRKVCTTAATVEANGP